MSARSSEKDGLGLLAAAPAIWAAHFLLSYATAAIWCAKIAGPVGSLAGARLAILIYTALALAGVGALGWRAYRRTWRSGTADRGIDPRQESARRFLGHMTLFLSGLSAVAILYAALAPVLIGDCR